MNDYPHEIGHVEEIEEEYMESEEVETVVMPQEVTKVMRSGSSNQKFVLIQSPEGVTRAVRVQASPASSSSAGTSSPEIQFLKTDSGSYIQIRNTVKQEQRPTQMVHRLSSPSTSNVVMKSDSGRKFVVNQPKVVQMQSSPQTKTITLAQAQQMGLLGKGATAPAGKVITLNPTIKHEPMTSKSVTTPQRIMKLATHTPNPINLKPVTGDTHMMHVPGSSGQPRAIVIPARPSPRPQQQSVQYVEVLQDVKEEVPMPRPVYRTLLHSPHIYESRGSPLQKTMFVQQRKEDVRMKVSNTTADRLLQLEGTVVIPGQNQTKFVMLPPNYIEQLESKEDEEDSEMVEMAEVVDETDIIEHAMSPTATDLIGEVAKKRPCNCTKSQCLKLYCECFANGEFCSDCNCKECFNTMENEEERQNAIYNCLERNPNAFRPKIGKAGNTVDGLRHHKGCNCKRSGCLKNYCECFEAKIPCSDNCKCMGCKNSEDHCLTAHAASAKGTVSAIKRAAAIEIGELRVKPNEDDEPPPKQPYNFMTADVVDATVQCMMAQADECQQNGVSYKNMERLILEEFGRCLAEIIDFSNKNGENENE